MDVVGHRSGQIGGADGEEDAARRSSPVSAGASDMRDAGEASSIETQIKVGNHHEALRLCTQQFGASIGRLCMALVGNQSEAEDLTQETFVVAFKGFEEWRGDGSLRAWLFGIAKKLSLRHVEKRTRRDAKLHLVDKTEAPATDELVQRRERAEHARSLLDALRPTEREALILRYTAEMSFQEVAEVVGIPESAARKRVSRGLGRLRDELKNTEMP